MAPINKTKGSVLPDLSQKKALQEKLNAALNKGAPGTKRKSAGYAVEPDFIRHIPTKGKNSGKKLVFVGFRSNATPDSDFIAYKVYTPHLKAILASIEAGHLETLKAMVDLLPEGGVEQEGDEE